MGGFADSIGQQAKAALATCHAIHERVADLAFDSVVNGSSFTGAPGQPMAAPIFEHAGVLRNSWTKDRVDANTIVISTDIGFAPIVEDNLKGVRFRDGGPHSVKLTVLAGDRLTELATAEIAGGGK